MRQPTSKTFIPSPVRKRNPKKSHTIVISRTREIKLKQVLSRLASLTGLAVPQSDATEWIDVDMENQPEPVDIDDTVVVCEPKTRRIVPDQATKLQYDRWLSLLPDLQAAYLLYLPEAIGIPMYPHQTFSLPPCSVLHCTGLKTAKILCLYLDCKLSFNNPFVLPSHVQTSKKRLFRIAHATPCRLFWFATVYSPLPLTSPVLHLQYPFSTSISPCLSVLVMPFMRLPRRCTLSMNAVAFVYKISR